MTKALSTSGSESQQAHWEHLSRGCALLAIALGATGLAGWIFHIDALTRIHPAFVTMKANTAICLMVAGSCLLLLQNESVRGSRRRLAQAGAAFIGLAGLLTLCEYLWHLNLGIDQLLFHETTASAGQSLPGRMGPASALVFILLALSLLFLETRFAQFCAVLAGIVTVLIFLIYFYKIETTGPMSIYLSIAFHTVVAFFALCLGVLFSRPRRSLVAGFLGDTLGAAIARRMLPAAFLVPALLGWLRVIGQQAGYYDLGLGAAAYTVLVIAVFAALIWWTARAVNAGEAKRQLAEEALRQSQAQRSAIIECSPVGVVLVDSRMRIQQVNPKAQPAFGALENLIERDLDEVLHILWAQKTADEVMGHFRHTLATGEPYFAKGFAEDRVDRPDREYYDWEIHRIDFPGGEHGVACYFIDISAHVAAQQKIQEGARALRESEASFRSMADNIGPLAWMANPDGWIFFYNQRWFEYTGATLESMQGWGWEKVHHPDHIDRVTRKWKAHLQKGQAWEDTFPLRGKDGAYRWFLSRAFPIRDGSGKITRWFGTNTDIHELREAQEALQQAQDELKQHAEKLEQTVIERTAKLRETVGELEAFSYSVAHDMRAPLRAMQGFSSILQEELFENASPAARDYLRRMAASASRLDALIQDVLNYSKVLQADLKLEPIDARKLINEIVESYPNLHGANCEIRVEEPIPAVLANHAALTQVISNLLGNAVKFVKPGIQPRVRIRPDETALGIRLWFEDNGIGIPKDAQERIFQMFQRLNPPSQYQGTGIGLTIVRKAVERMGGRIGLESTPGLGSKFWIELRRPAPPARIAT